MSKNLEAELENLVQNPGFISHIVGNTDSSNFVWSKQHRSVGLVDTEGAALNLDLSMKPMEFTAQEFGECMLMFDKEGIAYGLPIKEIDILKESFTKGYNTVFAGQPAIYANHFHDVLATADWILVNLREMAAEGIVDKGLSTIYYDLLNNKIQSRAVNRLLPSHTSICMPLSESTPRILQKKTKLVPEDMGIPSEAFSQNTVLGRPFHRILDGTVSLNNKILKVKLFEIRCVKGELLDWRIPLSHLLKLAKHNNAKILQFEVPFSNPKLARLMNRLYGEPQIIMRKDGWEWNIYKIPVDSKVEKSFSFVNRNLSQEEAKNFLANFEYYRNKKWLPKESVRRVTAGSSYRSSDFYNKLGNLKKGGAVRMEFVHETAKAFGLSAEKMLAKPKKELLPCSQALITEMQKKGLSIKRVAQNLDISEEKLYGVVNLGQGGFDADEILSLFEVMGDKHKIHLLAPFALPEVDMIAYVNRRLTLHRKTLSSRPAEGWLFYKRNALKALMKEQRVTVKELSRRTGIEAWEIENIWEKQAYPKEWQAILSSLETSEEDLLLRGFYSLSSKDLTEYRQCEKLLKSQLEKNKISISNPEYWDWHAYKFFVGLKQLYASTPIGELTAESIKNLITKIGI